MDQQLMNTQVKQNSLVLDNIKVDWYFYWNSGDDELTLRDKTKEEAYKIAKHFGWTPQVWYKPNTWGNMVRFSARQLNS
jgi:hypothetical protein